jgi:hypothetical protein
MSTVDDWFGFSTPEMFLPATAKEAWYEPVPYIYIYLYLCVCVCAFMCMCVYLYT